MRVSTDSVIDEFKYKTNFWYRSKVKIRRFFLKRKFMLASIIIGFGTLFYYRLELLPSEQERINYLRRQMLKDE